MQDTLGKLTPTQTRIYRDNRKRGLDPKTARLIAHYETAPQPEGFRFLENLDDMTIGTSGVFGVVEDFAVHVRVRSDDDARLGDDDVTGTFTDDYDPACIKKQGASDWGSNGDDYEWYSPSNYDRQYVLTGKDAPKGMSKGVVQDWIAERIRQAMREDRYRNYYGVIVDVRDDEGHSGEASLWGIDSTDGYNVDPYLREVARDLIGDAIAEAKRERADRRKLRDHTAEDEHFPIADWKNAVANDDTRLGYADWIAERSE